MQNTSDISNQQGGGKNELGFGARLRQAAWIESPSFDLLLLTLVPITVIPLIAGVYVLPGVVGGIAFALAFSHYASSFAFYFWDENKQYHRARWVAFFLGPIVILLLYLLMIGYRVPYFISVLVLFWNTWHVARQNCGILSLYRSKAQVGDPLRKQKSAANNAILSISFFLMLWNVSTHDDVVGLFSLVSDQLLEIVKLVMAATAIFFAAQLGLALIRRQEPLGIPEVLFLGASLAFFYPYLIGRNSATATAVMLLPHYVQYIALVWLLHRRKFGNADRGAPAVLLDMSRKLHVLVPSLAAFGFGFFIFKTIVDRQGFQHWFENFYLMVALTHFYIDGLNWSFRRPHVRQTILPFLLRRNSPSGSSS